MHRSIFHKADEKKQEKFHSDVDFKPIEDADEVLKECDQFLSNSQPGTLDRHLGGFTHLKLWRTKRRDMMLSGVFESLVPKIKKSETKLREIISESTEKKNALRLQAKLLLAQLQFSINYNKEQLGYSSDPVLEIRVIVNQLTEQSEVVKHMMTFNSEILRQRNLEYISKGRAFTNWSSKSPIVKATVTEQDLLKDEDHQKLLIKLTACRDMKNRLMSSLSTSLETRESHQFSLDNCLSSLTELSSVAKDSGSSSSMSSSSSNYNNNNNNGEDGSGDSVGPVIGEEKGTLEYHTQMLSFCSQIHEQANNCSLNLADYSKLASHANHRLQSIVELREKVFELGESLDFESPEVILENAFIIEKQQQSNQQQQSTSQNGNNHSNIPSKISIPTTPSSSSSSNLDSSATSPSGSGSGPSSPHSPTPSSPSAVRNTKHKKYAISIASSSTFSSTFSSDDSSPSPSDRATLSAIDLRPSLPTSSTTGSTPGEEGGGGGGGLKKQVSSSRPRTGSF